MAMRRLMMVVTAMLLYVAADGTIVGAAGAAGEQARQPRNQSATASDLSSALEATAQVTAPAVVEIFTTSYAAGDATDARSDLLRPQRASGSGVIVDAAGYIVTNGHVVRGAQQLRVELPSPGGGSSILAPRGRTVDAQIVGLDFETDLAVIKIDASGLATLPFGDSDELRMGQLVLAVGSPLGLQNSVTLGIVSAVGRQLEPESPMVYVQTDAPINPGNSGGPLVDLRGRLVGINTLILSSQRGAYEGIGFAAPSNIVRTVYEQIRKHGRVRRGDIGIRAQTITAQLAAGLGLPRADGVIVSDVVPGGMGHRAGLRIGDIVLTLDGKPMENGRQLQVGLYRHFVGEVVTLEILRDGKTDKFPVAIAERQDPLSDLSASVDPRENLVSRLGILGISLDRQIADMVPTLRVASGVVVVSSAPGAIDLRGGGLQSTDVIYAVNRTPVNGLPQLRAAVDALKPGDAVVLHVDRRGELMFVAFTVE
jgi:serine protease Do